MFSSRSSAAGAPAPAPRVLSERAIVLLIAAVQFVNILDFVMVMPMGPDFARALHFAESKNGSVAAAYTAAAAISGLAGSFFLDRFDRRRALIFALVGLSLGTLAGAFATGFHSLMGARALAGMFGGPATSVAFSIIADVVPNERRGRAMGVVMGAFGVASVLGVPAGLILAQQVSWRAPFVAVAIIGAMTAVLASLLLPAMRGHIALAASRPPTSLVTLLGNPLVRASYVMTAVVMTSGFIIIPNISAYLQENLGFPRSRIPLMYLLGGAVSGVLTPLVGRLVDRIGSFRTGTIGSVLLIGIVYATFYNEPHGGPILPWFVGFFIAMAFRNVAYNTLTTKVPEPQYRARFMSIQSSVQHGASSLGGFLSSAMLTSPPGGGRIVGMPNVATVTIALSVGVPFMLAFVERGVRRKPAPVPLPVAAGETMPAASARYER
jgi:predicted MFS family arabinose efflux permease